MADNLTNFIPGILFGAEGNKKCCCTGCKESECGEGKCGCAAGEACSGETACKKGTCDDGETYCACCSPGYAKASEEEDAECEYLLDECPSECPGTQADCTSGWEACGCAEVSTTCTAFEGDFSGVEPGATYTFKYTAEEATFCMPVSDIPTETPGKGFVLGQERKSCCGTCFTNIVCPTPGGGGGSCEETCGTNGGTASPCVSCAHKEDDESDYGVCISSIYDSCTCYKCIYKSDLCAIDPDNPDNAYCD